MPNQNLSDLKPPSALEQVAPGGQLLSLDGRQLQNLDPQEIDSDPRFEAAGDTFDPAATGNTVTLSDADTVASLSSTSGEAYLPDPVVQGLTIWELEIGGANPNTFMLGLRDATVLAATISSRAAYLGQNAQTLGLWGDNGQIYSSGIGSPVNGLTLKESGGGAFVVWTAGLRVVIAYNSETNHVWWGKVVGNIILWYANDSGDGDPFTGTNPHFLVSSNEDIFLGTSWNGAGTGSNSRIVRATERALPKFEKLDDSAFEEDPDSDPKSVGLLKNVKDQTDLDALPLDQDFVIRRKSDDRFQVQKPVLQEIASWVFDGSVSSPESNENIWELSPDGTTLLICTGNTIHQYTLTIPYFPENGISDDGSVAAPFLGTLNFVRYNGDGTQLFIHYGADNDQDTFARVDLNTQNQVIPGWTNVTPWLLTNEAPGYSGDIHDVSFNANGSKLLVCHNDGDDHYLLEFTLNTPYDVFDHGTPIELVETGTDNGSAYAFASAIYFDLSTVILYRTTDNGGAVTIDELEVFDISRGVDNAVSVDAGTTSGGPNPSFDNSQIFFIKSRGKLYVSASHSSQDSLYTYTIAQQAWLDVLGDPAYMSVNELLQALNVSVPGNQAAANQIVIGSDPRFDAIPVIANNADEILSSPLNEDQVKIDIETGDQYIVKYVPAADTSGYVFEGDLNYPFANGYDIAMSANGQYIFVTRFSGGDNIQEYQLNVPFRPEQGVASVVNSGSLGFAGDNFYMAFSPDGNTMYIKSNSTSILEVALTTPHQVSGGTTVVSTTNMTAFTNGNFFDGFSFNEDFTKVIVGTNTNKLYEWTLGTPGDLLDVQAFEEIILPGISNTRDVGYLDDDTIIAVNSSRYLNQFDITDRQAPSQMGATYTASSSAPPTSGSQNTIGMLVAPKSGRVLLGNFATAGIFSYLVMEQQWVSPGGGGNTTNAAASTGAAAGTLNLDWHTIKSDTGKKYHDGRTIYSKTIILTTLATETFLNSFGQTVAHGETIDRILRVEGNFGTSSSNYLVPGTQRSGSGSGDLTTYDVRFDAVNMVNISYNNGSSPIIWSSGVTKGLELLIEWVE